MKFSSIAQLTSLIVPLIASGIPSSLGVLAPLRASEVDQVTKWSKIELSFAGPNAKTHSSPNPFAIRLDVSFTGPSGRTYRVPGFYDGDGLGRPDGNVWKVRFAADQLGDWNYKTESPHELLNAQSGQFQVTRVADDARGFWKWGRLEYSGTPKNFIRYLKFRDGPYWLKAGCDDPENFLGEYEHYDSLEKRKAAVAYLAERGINSLYIMTHNIGGDDRDVWPWLGTTAREAMGHGGTSARFDIQKLDEWHQLFQYMQSKGVVPYLILEDDSAWKGYDQRRYYREIIARFGYLPAIVFNIGEESNENYSLAEGLQLAKSLNEIDPYNHPCGIHNVNRPDDDYIDSPHIDLTSIQTGQPGTRRGVKNAVEHNQIALQWLERCKQRGRRIPLINFDEGRPELDRRAWWSAYLGGGVWEAHIVEPYDQPLAAWEPVWTQLGGTRAFMESLPFWQMQPHNELVQSGEAFCLAAAGDAYALYLPSAGSITVNLEDNDGVYEYSWWNPDNGTGGLFQHHGKVKGGTQRFTSPAQGDWALRIVRSSHAENESAVYYPPPDSQGGWRRVAGQDALRRQVGMDLAKLDEAFEIARGSTKNGGLLVVRKGWLVYERYFGKGHREATPNLASCGKSVTSLAIGILLDRHPALFPDGLDQKVFAPKYLPPEVFPLSDPRMKEIRLGQLLSMSAGIRGNNPAFIRGRETTIDPLGPDGWQALVDSIAMGKQDGETRGKPVTTKTLWCPPGGGYSYATASIHLASVMLRHITGVELKEFVGVHLAEPLGWGRWGYGYQQHKQITHTPGGGGIALRGTDMVRLGYLLLRQGQWNERQIVPADYVRHCGRKSVYNPHFPYSLQFNINTDGNESDLPRDAFWKSGSGGHVLYVVPSLDLVVWKLGGRDAQYKESDTGIPVHPQTARQANARRQWRASIDTETAIRSTLATVVDAVLP